MAVIRKWQLLFGCFLFAAVRTAEAQPLSLYFHHLTPAAGLSQATNVFIARDSRGFVWLSSTDGLNRFDGQRVRVYRPDPANPHALPGANVQGGFFEDPATSDLWFCVYEGVCRYRRATDDFELFQIRENNRLIAEDYHVFHLDRSGKLWLRQGDASAGGWLYWFDTHTRRFERRHAFAGLRFSVIADPVNGAVRRVIGRYWGERPGLSAWRYAADGTLLRTDTFRLESPGGGRRPVYVYGVSVESDTLWWVASGSGLYALNPNKPRRILFYNDLFGKKIDSFNSLADDGAGHLYVSTFYDGLLVFDKTSRRFTRQYVHDPDQAGSLLLSHSDELYLDPDRNLWVTHWETGVDYANLGKPKFAVPLRRSDFQTRFNRLTPRAIAEDPEGRVWVGGYGGGSLVLDAAGNVLRVLPEETYVRQFFTDANGRFWMLKNQSLKRYLPEKRQFIAIKNPPDGETGFNNLCQTPDGALLIGGLSGLFQVKKAVGKDEHWEIGRLPPLALPDSAPGYFSLLFVDSRGRLFCARNAKTVLVLDGWRTRRPLAEIPTGGDLSGFWENPADGAIWLATTAGLFKVDPQTLAVLENRTARNGLPGGSIAALLPDAGNKLWLGTLHGLVGFDPASGALHVFTEADGLPGGEYETGAACRTRAGRLWFGGGEGLTAFTPDRLLKVEATARPAITGIRLNDLEAKDLVCAETATHNIPEIRRIELPYSQNTLSFDFAALEFSDPAHTRLRYRLRSYDQNWVETAPPGFARYPNLPPGRYVLEIMAANSDGIWNPEPRVLDIRVNAPYWQTAWFRSIVLMVIGGLAWWFYRTRLRQVRAQAEARQKAAELNLARAEFETRLAQSELATLRAQMNPHFIFNCLNSIYRFTLEKDTDTASLYLNKFSRLLRLVLENSHAEKISLENELTALRLYIEIEALRFKEKLSYQIEIEAEIDQQFVEVPPLLIQPFVENAIWHGLMQKEGGGLLEIRISQPDEQLLHIVITDNGIGRAAAAELASKSAMRHKSFGTQIAANRLEKTGKLFQGKAQVQIEDLEDASGKAAGTRVVLDIPV